MFDYLFVDSAESETAIMPARMTADTVTDFMMAFPDSAASFHVIDVGEEEVGPIDLVALRAHRAAPFGRALLDAASQPRPTLCAFPRASDFRGVGALGRMSVPL